VNIKQGDDITMKTRRVFVPSKKVVGVKSSVRHSSTTSKKLLQVLELKLRKVRLSMKEERCSTSMRNIKVSNPNVQRNRNAKRKHSVLDTDDVSTPKRSKSKTLGLTSNGYVFTEDSASMKQNRHRIRKWRKSGDMIKTRRQFGSLRGCEVKLERLPPEVLSRALAGEEVQQSVQMRPVTRMCHRHKDDTSSCFQESSGTNSGTKKETEGTSRSSEEGGIFSMQDYDNWGGDKIDSWGNVRFLSKEHGDFGESEEDWCGWWVRFDSLHGLYDANLCSVSDGVTESRIILWDDAFKAEVTSTNSAFQVPEQIECWDAFKAEVTSTKNSVRVPETLEYTGVGDEVQDADEDWAGWDVLYVNKVIEGMSSLDSSDENSKGFPGF
jgi:hypothetical protein